METTTTVNWDGYDLGGSTNTPKPFPTAGLYTLQLPLSITDEVFGTGAEGQLTAKFDPLTIRGGPLDGYDVRFVSVSTKRYSNRNACSMGDLLLAARSSFRPMDDEQWKTALKSLGGQFFEAFLDWEAYDKITQLTMARKMEEFPTGADGKPQRFFEVPDANSQGGKRRVWANIKIRYYRIPKD